MLSVIIPLGPDETELAELVDQLQTLPEGCEILLARSVHGVTKNRDSNNLHIKPRVVRGKSGRAGQMNAAAKSAKGEYLWFLHADSRLDKDTIPVLLESIGNSKEVLYFHDLAFLPDGPSAMPINSWGVKFRSNWLKTPFGDQGFCLSRELFHQLGGYREDVRYGEDHLLVWKALQAGIKVLPTGARLFTSARKYARNGWFNTTITHVYLWMVQAAPQFVILLKRRLS